MKNKINLQLPKSAGLTILLGVMVIIGTAGLVYWNGLIQQTALEVKNSKQEYNNELRYAQTITELRRDLQYTQEVAEFVAGLKIDKDNPLSFIEFVEGLGDSSDVEVELKRFEVGEATDLNIDIEAEGGWRDVNTFILMLENVPYYLDISEIKLSSTQSEDRPWRVNVSAKGYSK